MISLILIDEDDNTFGYTANDVSDMLDKPLSTLMCHCTKCKKLLITDFAYGGNLCDKCSTLEDWCLADTSHD